MKQRDITNFETNLELFYLRWNYAKVPILEAYLLLKYPKDLMEPMEQEVFDAGAKKIFASSGEEIMRMQKAISIAAHVITDMVLPAAKRISARKC
jgi:hypothetical protein